MTVPRWTVLVDLEPMERPCSIGDEVTAQLFWRDAPELPEHLRQQRTSGRPGVWYCDRYAEVLQQPFFTLVGVVRQILAVDQLCERREYQWVPVPGQARVSEMNTTLLKRVADTPPTPPLDADLRFLTEEQHLRELGDQAPNQTWRPLGFLVQLEARSESP